MQDYLEMASAAGADRTTIEDEFVAGALRKLAAALGTLNVADIQLQTALRVSAEHVLSNPQPAGTSAAVRNSLISAVEAIEAVGPEDIDLRRSAESLREDRPLSDQSAIIREFLSRSGPALRRLSER